MEYENLIDFLGSVWDARFQYQRCVNRVEELQRHCHATVTAWDGMPGRDGASRKDSPLVALADQRALLPELYRIWESRKEEVEQFLDKLEDQRFKAILKLRYVDLYRWPQVLETLEKSGLNYSERQMYNLHRAALKQAQSIWEERYIA